MNKDKLTAMELAWLIIYKYDEYNRGINNLKLNKLLFIIWGQYLCKYKETCFDETVEIWRHHGVVREVYSYFKKYMTDDINIEYEHNLYYPYHQIDKELLDIINETVLCTLDIDGWDIVSALHNTNRFPLCLTYIGLTREVNPDSVVRECNSEDFKVWKDIHKND